jgi:hypothetical protein
MESNVLKIPQGAVDVVNAAIVEVVNDRKPEARFDATRRDRESAVGMEEHSCARRADSLMLIERPSASQVSRDKTMMPSAEALDGTAVSLCDACSPPRSPLANKRASKSTGSV